MPTDWDGYKRKGTSDPKGRGRPRYVAERFNIRAEDLIVESRVSKAGAFITITHKPTGIVVDGNDPKYPNRPLAARLAMMRLLHEKLTGIRPEDVVPPAFVGIPYTEQQWVAIKAFYAEFPVRTPANLATSAKLANEAIAWYNERQAEQCRP